MYSGARAAFCESSTNTTHPIHDGNDRRPTIRFWSVSTGANYLFVGDSLPSPNNAPFPERKTHLCSCWADIQRPGFFLTPQRDAPLPLMIVCYYYIMAG